MYVLKKISKRVICYILVSVCIVILCFYLKRPNSLNRIIDSNGPVSSMHIDVHIFWKPETYNLPNKLIVDLDNEKDVNSVMSILEEYKYSKKLKPYTLYHILDLEIPHDTEGLIWLTIFYKNSDNKLTYRTIHIDAENDVSISNGKSDIYIDYRIVGSDKKLFRKLSAWISDNLPRLKIISVHTP